MTPVLGGVRRRLRRRLRRAGGYDELLVRVKKLESARTRQADKLARLQQRVGKTKERVDEISLTAYRAHNAYEVLSAQVGALEERLQDLAERLASGNAEGAAGADAATDSTRSLVEEIRDEHRRIRVRFGAVTQYEERLRRLESALAEEIAVAAELAQQAAQHGVLADAPTHGAVDLPDDPAPVTTA